MDLRWRAFLYVAGDVLTNKWFYIARLQEPELAAALFCDARPQQVDALLGACRDDAVRREHLSFDHSPG